jgi:hypothetical protein
VITVDALDQQGRPTGLSYEELDLAGRLSGDLSSLDDFARELGARTEAGPADGNGTGFLPRRINATPATVEKDLAKLVLALVDLVRRLMEKQAVRRINAGSLSDDEVERMGETFLKLDERMTELRRAFGLEQEELNLSLGPIRNLL